MKLYRVAIAAVTLGSDTWIGMTPAQLKDRRNQIAADEAFDVSGLSAADRRVLENAKVAIVRPLRTVQFIVGETVFLAAPPPGRLAAQLLPVDHDDGVRRGPKKKAARKRATGGSKANAAPSGKKGDGPAAGGKADANASDGKDAGADAGDGKDADADAGDGKGAASPPDQAKS